MYYVYNGLYVFDFIAHCWATFSALRALLSFMMNKNDDKLFRNDIMANVVLYRYTYTAETTISNGIFKQEAPR